MLEQRTLVPRTLRHVTGAASALVLVLWGTALLSGGDRGTATVTALVLVALLQVVPLVLAGLSDRVVHAVDNRGVERVSPRPLRLEFADLTRVRLTMQEARGGSPLQRSVVLIAGPKDHRVVLRVNELFVADMGPLYVRLAREVQRRPEILPAHEHPLLAELVTRARRPRVED